MASFRILPSFPPITLLLSKKKGKTVSVESEDKEMKTPEKRGSRKGARSKGARSNEGRRRYSPFASPLFPFAIESETVEKESHSLFVLFFRS